MKTVFHLFLLSVLMFVNADLKAQPPARKYDSTLTSGRVGYRVTCNNKSIDQNEVQVKLIGFDKSARDYDFYLHGRVVRAEIDDLNNDGFIDLIIYIYSGANGEYGSAYAFASSENKAVLTFALPDVLVDGKLKNGYKGHDEFSLMEGTLLRKFPLYNPADSTGKPTGGNRVVQYQAIPNGNGGLKFSVLRTYDTK